MKANNAARSRGGGGCEGEGERERVGVGGGERGARSEELVRGCRGDRQRVAWDHAALQDVMRK